MMKPEIFAKHAKKVVKDIQKETGVLSIIKYIQSKDNNLYVTDKNRIYRLSDANQQEGLYDINLNKVDENYRYPDAARFFNMDEYATKEDELSTVKLDKKNTAELIGHLKTLRKNGTDTDFKPYKKLKNVVIKLSCHDGKIKIENIFAKNPIFYEADSKSHEGFFVININASYLIEVLEMMNTGRNAEVEIKVVDPYKPVRFDSENNLSAVIMPVKITQ